MSHQILVGPGMLLPGPVGASGQELRGEDAPLAGPRPQPARSPPPPAPRPGWDPKPGAPRPSGDGSGGAAAQEQLPSSKAQQAIAALTSFSATSRISTCNNKAGRAEPRAPGRGPTATAAALPHARERRMPALPRAARRRT